ncbi:tetratricopeptide repeat protein [Chloroflexota bacterium]
MKGIIIEQKLIAYLGVVLVEDQDILEKAQRQVENDESQEAQQTLAAILHSDPFNIRAWELMAEAVDDPVKQADCYRRILQLDPGNKPASFKLAELTDRPAHQPPPEVGQIVNLLREVGLDALDRKTVERFKKLGVTITVGDDGYVSVESDSRVVKVHKGSMPTLFGHLAPEEIIDRAGEPLAPDARRTCPRCDAVIPRESNRCEWCSLSFTSEGEPIWE